MFLTSDTSIGLDIRYSAAHQSLTDSHAAAIEQALQDDWTVDRHVSIDESLAVMISAIDAASADRVFYVDAEPVGLSLSILQDDKLEHIGCYGSVESLVTAIRAAA